MSDLIEALTIFRKYVDCYSPTHCEHDVLTIMDVGELTAADAARVTALGFHWDECEDCWYSFRFGSA
jgi:hypothetical protein